MNGSLISWLIFIIVSVVVNVALGLFSPYVTIQTVGQDSQTVVKNNQKRIIMKKRKEATIHYRISAVLFTVVAFAGMLFAFCVFYFGGYWKQWSLFNTDIAGSILTFILTCFIALTGTCFIALLGILVEDIVAKNLENKYLKKGMRVLDAREEFKKENKHKF